MCIKIPADDNLHLSSLHSCKTVVLIQWVLRYPYFCNVPGCGQAIYPSSPTPPPRIDKVGTRVSATFYFFQVTVTLELGDICPPLKKNEKLDLDRHILTFGTTFKVMVCVMLRISPFPRKVKVGFSVRATLELGVPPRQRHLVEGSSTISLVCHKYTAQRL